MTPLSRREVLTGAAGLIGAAAVGGCSSISSSISSNREIRGSIVGGPSNVGHRLRDGGIPNAVRTERASVVIVGGGMAGLSAAWWLQRRGISDIRLLELHSACGGNSISGQFGAIGHPWGAHYVPIPNRESSYVHELFDELGITEPSEHVSNGHISAPTYKEEYLCGEPEERLFRLGEWQPGIVPSAYLSTLEKDQHHRFQDMMHTFQHRTGSDGRRAFAIPLELSSTDDEFRKLDTISFEDFLTQNGFSAPTLRWYVRYACRDDYGAEPGEVSAWAGIHYFAARNGWASNADTNDLVTWPEGNGWIVKRLTEKLKHLITTNALVHTVNPQSSPKGARVEYLDLTRNEGVAITCDTVIYAAPRFTAAYVVPELRRSHGDPGGGQNPWRYNPWMVANLSMSEPPDGLGKPMAWDNVIYDSDSLGYVAATHQMPQVYPDRTVLTYYAPLTAGTRFVGNATDPRAIRQQVLDTPWSTWRDTVLFDLERPHPKIRPRIEQLDVWLWGHGMITPSPNYIWHGARADMRTPLGRMWFAHSDMSGISIFEEAQFRGVEAAHRVLEFLKI